MSGVPERALGWKHWATPPMVLLVSGCRTGTRQWRPSYYGRLQPFVCAHWHGVKMLGLQLIWSARQQHDDRQLHPGFGARSIGDGSRLCQATNTKMAMESLRDPGPLPFLRPTPRLLAAERRDGLTGKRGGEGAVAQRDRSAGLEVVVLRSHVRHARGRRST